MTEQKVFTKEVLQEMFTSCTDQSLARDIAEKMKNFKYVTASNDETCGFILSWHFNDEDVITWSDEYNHYVTNTSVRLTCLVYLENYDNFCLRINTEELTPPVYEKITIKHILDLEPISDEGDIYNYVEDIFQNECIDNYGKKFENIKVLTLMEYSQGYSGKYGQVLSVITYNDEKVAIVSTGGKWTDSHSITPVSENYYKMVRHLRTELFDYVCDICSEDDEFLLPSNLEDMYGQGIKELQEV